MTEPHGLYWTCDKCGTRVRWRARNIHRQNNCPMQGRLKAELDNPLPPKPCMCGCHAMVPQDRRKRAKNFATQDCYERWRYQNGRGALVRRKVSQRTEEQSMALVEAKQEAVKQDADRVAALLKPPEDSHALWLKCLGVG